MYEALFDKIITGRIISETDLTKEKPGELFVFECFTVSIVFCCTENNNPVCIKHI